MQCEECQKKSSKGRNVTRSGKRNIRRFGVNVHKVKVLEEGEPVEKTLCSSCIKKYRKKQN